MSLINDALKKAQRQRTGESSESQPPMPGGGVAPARPIRTGQNANPPLLLIGAGVLAGLVIAGGAFFLLRSKPASETPPAVAVSTPAPDASPAKTVQTPAPSPTTAPAPAANSPEPTFVVKTEPPALAPVSAPPATLTTAAVEKATPLPAPAPTEPPAPSPRLVEAIEALRVTGIRVGAGSDAKVLMNDRVYRLGDTVDHALGIKLTGATASSLTFRDATGATYTRNF
jgi:hypothetical protein